MTTPEDLRDLIARYVPTRFEVEIPIGRDADGVTHTDTMQVELHVHDPHPEATQWPGPKDTVETTRGHGVVVTLESYFRVWFGDDVLERLDVEGLDRAASMETAGALLDFGRYLEAVGARLRKRAVEIRP